MKQEMNWITRALVLVSVGGLAISLPTSVFAQAGDGTKAPTRTAKTGPQTVEGLAAQRAEKVGQQIGLNAGQIAKLAKLNTEAMLTAQTLFNTRPSDKADARTQLLNVLNTRQKGLDAVLTPEQREKYAAIAVKDLAALQSEVISRKLKLNANQLSRLNSVNQQAIVRVQTAMSYKEKSKQVEGIQKTRAWKDGQYKNILTSAQYQSLKQMRQYMTPTNADTRLEKSDIRHNPSTGPVVSNPFGVYQISPAIPVGYGSYGGSVVYPTFWVW